MVDDQTHTLDNTYFDIRIPKSSLTTTETCYLCDSQLLTEPDSDHIIPQALFTSESPNLPQLPVHRACNNRKSLDDKHFVSLLDLISQFNPDADSRFRELLRVAEAEQKDAYLIGRSHKVRNLRFAKTLMGDIKWGLELPMDGTTYAQMYLGEKNFVRMERYVQTLTRGLFIRNIEDSKPSVPQVHFVQYAQSTINGRGKEVYERAQELLSKSTATAFAQYWPCGVSYFGSRTSENPNRGYCYIHFHHQVGFLALFT